MPLHLPRFGRKDKAGGTVDAPSPSVVKNSSTGSPKSSEYVLPGLNTPSDFNGDEMGFRATSPPPRSRTGDKDPRTTHTHSDPRAAGSNHRLHFTMPGFKRKPSPQPTIGMRIPFVSQAYRATKRSLSHTR